MGNRYASLVSMQKLLINYRQSQHLGNFFFRTLELRCVFTSRSAWTLFSCYFFLVFLDVHSKPTMPPTCVLLYPPVMVGETSK